MKRLDALDLDRLHDLAPEISGAFYHPDFITWLLRAVKNGAISEDRFGLYLTDAQRGLWHY